MTQPTNESQPKVGQKIDDLIAKFTDYEECDEWHIHDETGRREGSTPLPHDFDDERLKAALLPLITEERLDELNHLGYDRRLDNPIISCYNEADFGAITLEERKQQLKALSTKKENHNV